MNSLRIGGSESQNVRYFDLTVTLYFCYLLKGNVHSTESGRKFL